MKPKISIVIPVHNEQEVLDSLFKRLLKVMDDQNYSYEVILTNDGSSDNTESILNSWQQKRPDVIRVQHFNSNYGQHMAIMAGFEIVRGEIIITLDADLQNPPEEIPKLIKKMDEGYDVVGGYRMDRQDSAWRLWLSKMHNKLRERIAPQLRMKDEGCMLRAYSRRVVDLMVSTGERSTFIPALALTYAHNPTDIGVAHAAREEGTSSYNFYKLIRYNFDLITNFSLVPLQVFTMIGIIVSILSTGFVMYLFLRRFWVGPEADGLFTLFAILFLLVGILLMGLGILGEYIGRIYMEIRKHPRFIIREIRETSQDTAGVINE